MVDYPTLFSNIKHVSTYRIVSSVLNLSVPIGKEYRITSHNMTMRWILLPLFALFPLSLSYVDLEYGGTQFITYNGTIAGHFTHPASAPPDCPTYYFDSIRDAFISIGVNPPWDTNPSYFNIQHNRQQVDDGSMLCESYRCTLDPIYRLEFTTVDYICFKDDTGNLCGMMEWDFHFVPYVNLDLNQATIVQYDWGDAGKGYRIAGDQSTFRDSPYLNSFEFQRPFNYSRQDGCANLLTFQWYILPFFLPLRRVH
jgi:hypothetical protein